MFFIASQEIVSPYQTIQTARNRVAELTHQHAAVLAMFDALTSALPMDSPLLDAICYAAEKHQFQVRKDAEKTPYIIHPMGVALSLWEEGDVRNRDALLAALLHDTLEDTDATQEEISAKFGLRVAAIVEQLTNPADLSTDGAKAWQIEHAPTMCIEAKLIKLADRLYNIRDLRPAPAGWSAEKVAGYYQWGQKLLNVLKGTNPQLESLLQAEIDASNVVFHGRLPETHWRTIC